jgi:hypothetical protein
VAKPLNLFVKRTSVYYYIDKTLMIAELLEQVDTFGIDSICVTRPRRFGKSMMAEAIAAFFTKGLDSTGAFSGFKISETEAFSQINSRNVFYIDMSEVIAGTTSCDGLIIKLSSGIIEDLLEAFPNVKQGSPGQAYSVASPVADRPQMSDKAAMLMDNAAAALTASSEKFVFVIDEWDSPFEKPYMTEGYKLVYLEFLKRFFKQQDFNHFTYFTGVLPIPSYSNVSALNNFKEFILGRDKRFSQFFGFTHEEVSELFKRYEARCGKNSEAPKLSLRVLKRWYNGYKTPMGANIYNPLSVVFALTDNVAMNYWARSGKSAQVLDCLRYNFSGVLGDIASLIKDESLVLEKADASLQNLVYGIASPKSRNEVLSMLVAVGLLTYSGKKVSIPNEEVRQEFFNAIMEEKRFGELHQIVNRSERILASTLSKDANAVAELLSDVHDNESPILFYNNEAELAHVICMACLSAMEGYERARQAGNGYADVLFTPIDPTAPAFVVELKADAPAAAGTALAQIKERNYHKAFSSQRHTGPVLLVAISYDGKTKIHTCLI